MLREPWPRNTHERREAADETDVAKNALANPGHFIGSEAHAATGGSWFLIRPFQLQPRFPGRSNKPASAFAKSCGEAGKKNATHEWDRRENAQARGKHGPQRKVRDPICT